MTIEADWPHENFARTVPLPAQGHLPALQHVFASRDVWAIRAARAAGRPLLVRGAPGTGKSQLARAAAEALELPLVSEVVTSGMEPSDLLYRFDAVARLGQAQVLAAGGAGRGSAQAGSAGIGSKEEPRVGAEEAAGEPPLTDGLASLAERLFLAPGPLWWVFDWDSAQNQRKRAGNRGVNPEAPGGWKPPKGAVLLIDEIDKADADLPNSLLESLGNGEFHVPYLERPVRCSTTAQPPLIIITTNEERELPAAFVRRCLVLELSVPEGEALERRLLELGQAHFGDSLSEDVYKEAARQLRSDRERLAPDDLVKPGPAEYLDLLRAVLELSKDGRRKALDILADIKGFALSKNPSLRR